MCVCVCVRVRACVRMYFTHYIRMHACRKKFSGDWFHGKVLGRSIDGLATDAKPRYYIKYEDDDEEELYVEEILPLLKVRANFTSPPRPPSHTPSYARILFLIEQFRMR